MENFPYKQSYTTYKMSSIQKYDLIKWDTPFSGVTDPSVWIIGDEQDEARNLTVAVAPEGLDEYPKYLIRFSNVLAYKSEEEAQWTENFEEKLILDPSSKCSFLRPKGSFWWDAYGGQMRDFYNAEPMHFYLLGGDNLVEVFAANNPLLTKVKEQEIINLKYVV